MFLFGLNKPFLDDSLGHRAALERSGVAIDLVFPFAAIIVVRDEVTDTKLPL